MIFAEGKYSNTNTERFAKCMTFLLFDNEGNLFGIYKHGMEYNDEPVKDRKLSMMFIPYTSKATPFVWPEKLVGDLRCVVITYFAENIYDLWHYADFLKFDPNDTPPDPNLWK